MPYTSGLHILGEFESGLTIKLQQANAFKEFVENAINEHGLSKLGDFYHHFSGAGYTAVVCLTESHIAIHTWPEYNRVTYDVFLSNYMHVNNGKAIAIANGIEQLFEAYNSNQTHIER